MATRIGPGVLQIDTLLGGWERMTAGYLVEGPSPVLVETGSQSSVPALLAALDELNVAATDLAGVAVTHIHLDHAGGVGDVARAFPNATVYVHEKGARHLVDPSRLVRSAAMVYGDLLDTLYGRLDPTPPERLQVLADGEEIVIGPGRSLTTVDSPGHAKHHLALHDSESGLLFCGDAVGVKLPDGGVLRPSTPPPDFDLDLALHSLGRFAERRPSGLALAHYGVLPDPQETLEEAGGVLRQWAEVAEAAWRDGQDIAEALDAKFAPDLETVAPEQREKVQVLSGVHSNAAGFRRWLDTREATIVHDHPHAHLTMASTPLIGAHLKTGDPLAGAAATDSACVQIFLSDPQGWAKPKPRDDAEALRASAMPVYVHAPYLVNLASPNPRIRHPSRQILAQTCAAAAEVGATAVIVHGGHVTEDDSIEAGADRWAKALAELHSDVPVYLENTAGGDHAMARHFDTIAQLWERIGEFGIGFCLDTCHTHAAGEEVVGAVERIMAITGRIDLVHCNDSKDEAGSGRDRHEHLGRGRVALDALLEVVRTAGAPVICETPVKGVAADIALLRERL